MRERRQKLQPGQKRYSVGGILTISMHTEVIASSPEEARRIAAEERGIMTLCHACASGSPEVEWITSGELDGDLPEPYDGETEYEVVEL